MPSTAAASSVPKQAFRNTFGNTRQRHANLPEIYTKAELNGLTEAEDAKAKARKDARDQAGEDAKAQARALASKEAIKEEKRIMVLEAESEALLKKRMVLEAEFNPLKKWLRKAWDDSKYETKMQESAWNSTCFYGSLSKLIRMLAFEVVVLPILTLFTDAGAGAAVIVAFLASYLQFACMKLHIFIAISSALFYFWCLYRGLKGPNKDILDFAERIGDINTVELLMKLEVCRSNPYTKRLTVSRYLTVCNHLEYGFNTKEIWRLNLDEMDFLGTPCSFACQSSQFQFEMTPKCFFEGKSSKNSNLDNEYRYLIQIRGSYRVKAW